MMSVRLSSLGRFLRPSQMVAPQRHALQHLSTFARGEGEQLYNNQVHMSLAWRVAAAGGALVGCGGWAWTGQTECDGSGGESSRSWWTSWFRRSQPNAYVQEMRADPRVGVVLAATFPFLSLSFGLQPSRADMTAAEGVLLPEVPSLEGWELASLLWGAAHLGHRPSGAVLLQEDVQRRLNAGGRPLEPSTKTLHRSTTGPNTDKSTQGEDVGSLSPADAALILWALALSQQLTCPLWDALLDHIAAASPDTLDKVTLLHMYQAACYAEPQQIGLEIQGRPSVPQVRTTARPQLRAEVASKLRRLPPSLVTLAENTYTAHTRVPGFDCMMVELTLLSLVSLMGSCPEAAAYRHYLHDFGVSDISKVNKVLHDPYLLRKFEGEVADKRMRQNRFMRQLNDISRTLQGMGLYHVLQTGVEDGLVHVDVALPDYKIALFLEGAAQGSHGMQGKDNTGGQRLTFLDPEGSTLTGYVANETPGMRRAKQQLLEQLGWKCFSISWLERTASEADKRLALLRLIDKAGKEHAMQGRVSSLVHGAVRGVGDDTSRFQQPTVGSRTSRHEQ